MWEYKSHPENIMVSQTNCASSCPLACMLIAVWGLPTNPKSWVCWRSWFVLHQRPEIHHVAKLWHVALMLQIVLNTGVQTPKTNTKTMTKTISEGVWSSRVCVFLFCVLSITSRRGLVFRALRNPCAHAHRLLAALDLLPNCGKRLD